MGPAERTTAVPGRGSPAWQELDRRGVDAAIETDAPGDEPIAAVDAAEWRSSVGRFINRELSWLDFGARLLDLASDERLPLFERIKFLALFSEGLDEFFQVRVAGLEDQVAAGLRVRSPDGMGPAEQLAAIAERTTALVARQSAIFARQVRPGLAGHGVAIVDFTALDEDDRAHLAEVFHQRIFPILTPLAVDQAHPFPYISNLSLNLVVRVEDPSRGDRRIARVKVPPLLPRFVVLPDGRSHVPVEQVIAAHLSALFPSMAIVEHHAFRVTRNADLSVEEDEAQDLPAAIELELHRRRFGQAVRLEVAAAVPSDLLTMLIDEVDVPEDNVFLFDVPLDLGGLRCLTELARPDLAPEPWTPLTPPQLATERDIFAVLAEGDVLVHHPYESFAASVEAFIARAAEDPDVLAIKQTLYRTGEDSPAVSSLIRASQSGKLVTAVVELQARFDEQANLERARALEEAGVQVIYGLVRFKTHSKISLVVRREGDRTRRYCHVGSGNYNATTARIYEDVGLLTADPEVCADVGELFNLLTGSGDPPTFRRLTVSPLSTRSALITSIREETEAGEVGRIVLKTNGLTDPEIIDALYEASRAGVTVDLVVRGFCCLRPGIEGLSENITVRSIVGRFLEHSRIFCFGGEHGRTLRVSFGSPDLMERNLDRRVEVVVPVEDPTIQRRLVGVLDDAVRDEANSWVLAGDGRWTRVAAPEGPLGFSLQDHLRAQAVAARRRHLDEVRSDATRPRTEDPAPPTPPKPTAPTWWRRRRAKSD
jgi:polyphosphate kinase